VELSPLGETVSAAAVMVSELLASPLTFKGNKTSSMSDTEYVATSNDKKWNRKIQDLLQRISRPHTITKKDFNE
jgi:hypothetical protein